MTTKHRRITISLPPEVDEAVVSMATAQGIPQAKVVTDILIEFAPTLVGLAKLTTQVKAGQHEAAKRTLRHTFGDQMAMLMAQQMELPATKGKRK